MVLGCTILGVAQAVTIAGCSLLSAIWFPVTERIIATSIAVQSTVLGIAVGFVLGKPVNYDELNDSVHQKVQMF